MRRELKLYNVLLPIWILYFFPQVWLITLPGNLLIDCTVLLLTLAVLKHTQKKAVLKKLWWKFWLLGFLADFIGALFLCFIELKSIFEKAEDKTRFAESALLAGKIIANKDDLKKLVEELGREKPEKETNDE